MKTGINTENITSADNTIIRYKKGADIACALMSCIMDEEEINSNEVINSASDKVESLKVSFGLICNILAEKNYISRDYNYGIGNLFRSKEDLDSDYMRILKNAYASLQTAKRFLMHIRHERQVVGSDYISYLGIFSGAELVMKESIEAARRLPNAATLDSLIEAVHRLSKVASK